MLDGKHGAEARATLSRRLRDGVFPLGSAAGGVRKAASDTTLRTFLQQRECLLFDEHLPHCKEIRIIDGEHVNCDAADGGCSNEFCSCPREMVVPSVLAW